MTKETGFRHPRGPWTRGFRSFRGRLRVLLGGSAAGLSLALVLAGPVDAQGALRGQSVSQYLSVAEKGVIQAGSTSNWGNPRYHWYNELLNDTARSPQATIWPIVPLFETVDYDALADPSTANLNLVKHFAAKAETYWDKNITPAPGVTRKTPAYAPYPGSYNDAETFFDDNAWWSLAFMDAYQVMVQVKNSTLATRYLNDAARGFNFIRGNAWDHHDGGGMWWNTLHAIPGGHGRSGEALGAATDLAARLYQATGKSVYLTAAVKYITWANHHLLKWDGGYANVIPREVTMPHDGEGAMIAAYTALCEARASVPRTVYAGLPRNKTRGVNPSFRRPAHPSSWCSWAEAVAHHTAFGVNPGGGTQDRFFPLREGPQWDAIYLRGLLSLYAYDHLTTWYRLATDTAQRILKNAQEPNGLFLKDWSGSTKVPGSPPGEIRTDAASLSVFAALAASPTP
jgi:hypothetical protein